MGATFTGATIVPTGSTNFQGDSIMPGLGALSLGAMTSDSALAPTNGVDVKSVHGRRDQMIDGDMREQIHGKLETTISRDEKHTVIGNQKETVRGIVNLTVVGGWQEEQMGPVNRHYRLKVTDTFDNDHDSHVPENMAFNASLFSNTAVGGTQIGVCTGFYAALTTALSLTLANLDLEGKMLHAEGHPLHFAWAGNETEASEAKEHISAIKVFVAAEGAVRTSVNVLVDLDTGTPFT